MSTLFKYLYIYTIFIYLYVHNINTIIFKYSDEDMTCAHENYANNITEAVHRLIDLVDSMDMQSSNFADFCRWNNYI